MQQLNNNIKVTIIYESKYTEEFTLGVNDSIEKVINEFSTKNKIDKSSLYLLYSGNLLQPHEYKKTFYEIMNNTDKKSNCLVILAYRNDIISEFIPESDTINIFLIQDSKVLRLQGTKKETFKEIFEKAGEKIGCNLKQLDFIYNKKGIDINKKFMDIADKNDQKKNGIAIYINRKDSIFVNFHKENLEDRCYNSFEEELQTDLCKKYSHDINMNYKDLIFSLGEKPITKGKTIGQLLREMNDKSIGESNENVLKTTENIKAEIKDMREIDIYVNEISCFKKHKKLIIILSIIPVLAIAGIIVSIFLNNKKDDEKNKTTISCNYGYKLYDNECKIDYFIIAVYNTQQKREKINLMQQYSGIEHIYIEGKKLVLSATSYQFEEEGDHIVYIQPKEGSHYNVGLFKGIKNIKSVNFTDFNEHKIDIPLDSLFAGCTDLYSVDFSKVFYEYISSTNDMFNGCINLKYVNIKNIKISVSSNYMFANCRSLTSIDLSMIDGSNVLYLENMFKNCISLQNINLKNFKINSAENINCMFCDCHSLKTIDISSFNPILIKYMNSTFYNCISLTSINFQDFYTPELIDISYLFYNCNSLKEINLFFLDTKNIKIMDSMFQGCNSLTSIIFGPNFITNKVYGMKSLFSGCHSLKSIDLGLTVTREVSVLSYLFNDCYSLTSINLLNFDVSNVSKFEYMFRNCYSLEKIDVSNFNIMDSSDLTGMFYGCSLLTSIDLSNILKYRYILHQMFYDCPKLKYVDFSSISGHINSFDENNEPIMNLKLFNKNISQNGVLVLNEDFYYGYVNGKYEICPSNWILNLLQKNITYY